jgi:hypothetical protein
VVLGAVGLLVPHLGLHLLLPAVVVGPTAVLHLLLLHALPRRELLGVELLLLLLHGAALAVSSTLATIPALSHATSMVTAASAIMAFVLSTSHPLGSHVLPIVMVLLAGYEFIQAHVQLGFRYITTHRCHVCRAHQQAARYSAAGPHASKPVSPRQRSDCSYANVCLDMHKDSCWNLVGKLAITQWSDRQSSQASDCIMAAQQALLHLQGYARPMRVLRPSNTALHTRSSLQPGCMNQGPLSEHHHKPPHSLFQLLIQCCRGITSVGSSSWLAVDIAQSELLQCACM